MSFGGPIDSMINSNKSNLGQLRKRKGLKELVSQYKTPHKELIFERPSAESERLFREHLVKEKRKDRLRKAVAIVLTAVIAAAIFYLLYNADYSRIIEIIK